MTQQASRSVAERFRFSERAESFRLREASPHVHGYAWRHPAPKASLILVHGLQSHAQWFAEAADTLLERGYSVYALDRRGSGSSPGERGDIARYTDWFDEVAEGVRLARSEHPDVPAHLVGHCFGANLALGSILTHNLAVRSLVMLTPGLFIRPDYGVVDKARIMASGLLRPATRFPVPQDDDQFTRDPEVLAWIGADALGSKSLTARTLLQINRMGGWLRRNVGRLAVPALVLEASHDRIAHNPHNRRLLRRVLNDRCRFVTFDAEHFLLAERCRDEVLDTLITWVKDGARIVGSAPALGR